SLGRQRDGRRCCHRCHPLATVWAHWTLSTGVTGTSRAGSVRDCLPRGWCLFYRERGGPPGLEAALYIGRAGKAELLQRRRRQAGLIALVTQQDDVIAEFRRIGLVVPACRVQP